MTFRAVHHSHAAAAVTASLSGLAILFVAGLQAQRTAVSLHGWASLPMLPLGGLLTVTLGRRFFRVRGAGGAVRFDAVLTRCLLLVGGGLIATGALLLPAAAVGPTAHMTLRQAHHALTEVAVPLLLFHVGLAVRRRRRG